MKKMLIMLVLTLATTSLFAANAWTGAGGDDLWTNPDNWAGTYPDTSNQIQIQGDGEVVEVLDGDNITVSRMIWLSSSAYDETSTTVNFKGGSFTCSGYWMVPNAVTTGTDPNDGAVINLSGNAYVQTSSISLGIAAPNMTTGGVAVANLNITDNARMYVSSTDPSTYRYSGFVAPGDLNKYIRVRTSISGSGTLEVNNLVVGAGEDVIINITGDGTLKVKGDKETELTALNSAGQLITDDDSTTPVMAYDGTWTIVMSPDNSSLAKPNTPVPSDNSAAYTIADVSWTPGNASNTWDLYLGTDPENLSLVESGLTIPEYQLLNLEFDTTYYWRVDEFNGSTTITGDVWSFYVRDYSQLFWFEYEDQTSLEADWTANGVTLAPSADPARGDASMAISYNNTVSPYLGTASSISVPFSGNIACTSAYALSVWIYGDLTNSDEVVYVSMTDGSNTATVKCPVAYVTQMPEWTIWDIDLRDFATIDMGNVSSVVIGVGDPDAPTAGGTGTIYVDNFNLYPVRCLNKPAADLNDDCKVTIDDLALVASEWLANGWFPIVE